MIGLRTRTDTRRRAFSTLLLALFGASAALAAPKITVTRAIWDFGRVWVGDACETEITMRNIGDAPLRIIKVSTTCGCTVARSTKLVLEPGESDTLKVTFDTKQPKPIAHQKITIDTNDPQRPSVDIEVKGSVLHVYRPAPDDKVYFGQVPETAQMTKSLDLFNNMDHPVSLKLKPVEDKNYDVKLEEVEAGQKYRLTVTTRPPLPIGFRSLELELETGVEKLPIFPVSIGAHVLSPVSVVPTRIEVPFGDGLPTSRPIQLRYLPDKKLTIKEITSNSPRVKARQLPPREKKDENSAFESIGLMVDLPAFNNITPGMELVIATDSADERYQRLVVPIVQQAAPKASLAPTSRPANQPSEPGAPRATP